MTRQAKAMLDSWMSLREADFRRIVSHSSLTADMKQALYRINLRHAWWETGDDEAHRMARRIMKHIRKRIPFPNPMHCRTMSMDGKIASIQPSNGGEYYHWARISTLTRNKPIHAPLIIHADLEPHLHPDDPETLANHLQLRVNEDGTLTARLMTTQDKPPVRQTGDTIGLDWGMQSLFATSTGRLYGLRLFAWLKQRDDELLALIRDLARSNVRYKQSKRYRRFNKRIRDYVTNEVNRVLNLIADDQVRELVVEDLDFRHGGLSKHMNRLVTRAGRGAVRRKLRRLESATGITVTPVNPAYTSQECPSCGGSARILAHFGLRPAL
ncbi:transposase [Bifidobacterium jacchi]|uniref:transposase n=1 Tax=Bifidobacterium jacchi TaxID=2490545 RepID=UPI0015880210|nr:transposase [Bifidobacterium jacchi]